MAPTSAPATRPTTRPSGTGDDNAAPSSAWQQGPATQGSIPPWACRFAGVLCCVGHFQPDSLIVRHGAIESRSCDSVVVAWGDRPQRPNHPQLRVRVRRRRGGRRRWGLRPRRPRVRDPHAMPAPSSRVPATPCGSMRLTTTALGRDRGVRRGLSKAVRKLATRC